MSHETGISQSLEDYLEIIYLLKQESDKARVKDIALHLEVSLPSVTEMIRKLSNKGLVNFEKYGLVELTAGGEAIAKQVSKRHELLTKFFVSIGVDKKTALHDACLAEHVLSKRTIDKIDEYVRK